MQYNKPQIRHSFINIITFILCLFPHFQCFSNDAPAQEVCCPLFSRDLYPHYIYLGLNCGGLNMHMPLTTHVNTNCSTVLGGMNLGYEYLKPSSIYAGLDAMIDIGRSCLDLKDGATPVISPDARSDLLAGELRLGYTLIRKNCLFTPCAGVGIYFLDSLEQISMSLDIPYALLGLRMIYQQSSLFEIGLNLTAYGEFHKKLSCDVFDQHYPMKGISEWGGSLALPLIWHVDQTRRWELRLEPFITAFSFSQRELFYGAIFKAGYHI